MKVLKYIACVLSLLYICTACSSEDNLPFNFYTASEFTDNQQTVITESAQTWNELTNCYLFYFIGSHPAEILMNQPLPSRADLHDGINTVYYTNTGDNQIGLAGLTILTSDTDTDIIQADMFVLWNNTWEDKNILSWVILHEFGHWLGLRHISPEEDPDSIMHPLAPLVIPATIIPSARDITIVRDLWIDECQYNTVYDISEYNPLFDLE